MRQWYWHEVETSEGRRSASKAGMVAALAFAALILLGLILTITTYRTVGLGQALSSRAELIGSASGIVIEMLLALIAALRFYKGRGLIMGSIVFVLFLFELIVKAASGTGAGFIIVFLAIGAGLIGGIRSAWANRQLSGAEQLSETFD